MRKLRKWVRVKMQCREWGRERQSNGEELGKRERALNSEAIIKWNMERALEGTSESALCILMECETVWKPLY